MHWLDVWVIVTTWQEHKFVLQSSMNQLSHYPDSCKENLYYTDEEKRASILFEPCIPAYGPRGLRLLSTPKVDVHALLEVLCKD